MRMASIVFRLIGGGAFILLGRWAYRNLGRIYASWFYVDPKPPALVTIVVRIWAVLLFFGGSYALLTVITERIAKGWVGVFVALGFAAFFTWFARRNAEADPSN
jgi:hypothetical protein